MIILQGQAKCKFNLFRIKLIHQLIKSILSFKRLE